MNKYITLIILASILPSTETLAQTTGSGFSYQGELLDNGSPANGDYDITATLFFSETGGKDVMTEDFLGTPVVNGLFSIEIDFGDLVYEVSEQYYIEISIAPSSGGSPTILAPRTKLLAVPYAVQAQYLAPGGASNGDVLTFDGMYWVPAANTGSSAWDVNGNVLSTPSRVGIGTSNPTDRLHVNSLVGVDALRIQVDNATKLRVFSNGGTSLGANNTSSTPDNGLYVAGDVKQSQNSNGMLKYMIFAQCDSFPTIEREYNGTPVAGTASITNSSDGRCDVILPFDTANSYVVVSATNPINLDNRSANCIAASAFIRCKFEEAATGDTVDDAFFTLLVY